MTPMRWLLFSWMCLLALAGSHEAHAAEISLIDNIRGYFSGGIVMRGEIQEGDYAELHSILAVAEPHANAIFLVSKGGNVAEAMKIGELVRQRLLATFAPIVRDQLRNLQISRGDVCTGEKCICASACFLIWAAGVERLGTEIMVHRPRDASGTFGSKPVAQASEQYRDTLSRIDHYLRRMEVPPNVIEMMRSTPSNDISPLPFEVAVSMETPPSIKEWLIPDCGAMTSQEVTNL